MDRDVKVLQQLFTSKVEILNNESYTYKGIKFFGNPNCRFIHGFKAM